MSHERARRRKILTSSSIWGRVSGQRRPSVSIGSTKTHQLLFEEPPRCLTGSKGSSASFHAAESFSTHLQMTMS